MKKRLQEAGIFSNTMRGKVVYFNNKKGYGFINSDGKDYFLHMNSLQGDEYPRRGDIVAFKPAKGRKGGRVDKLDAVDAYIV